MTDRQLELEPDYVIDPSDIVTRIPGIDARCEAGHGADECRWPFCCCRFPDRPPYEEDA